MAYQKPAPRFVPKTPAQQKQEALQRAIARAKAEGLAVIGSGRMIDGRSFWLVPSCTDSLEHHTVVQNNEQRLQCNCTAGLYGKICQHRACVYLHLVDQANAAKRQPTPAQQPAKPVTQATQLSPARQAMTPAQRRETALLDTGDEEEFSIYKTPARQRANYQPVAARAQADAYGDSPDYVPADYRSHEYR